MRLVEASVQVRQLPDAPMRSKQVTKGLKVPRAL